MSAIEEFAVKWCHACQKMNKHRILRTLETHPINKSRTCQGRCTCGQRAIVGMPPTAEDMAEIRRQRTAPQPDPDDPPME